MKIYLYDAVTGIYQGEDFADLPLYNGGPAVIQANATTIAPPSYARGEVAVFLAAENRWEIVPVSYYHRI